MERAVLAGKALGDELCVCVDEDGHERLSAVGGSIRSKRIFAAPGAINLAVVEVFGEQGCGAESMRCGQNLAVPIIDLISPLEEGGIEDNLPINRDHRKREQPFEPAVDLVIGEGRRHLSWALHVANEFADHLSRYREGFRCENLPSSSELAGMDLIAGGRIDQHIGVVE